MATPKASKLATTRNWDNLLHCTSLVSISLFALFASHGFIVDGATPTSYIDVRRTSSSSSSASTLDSNRGVQIDYLFRVTATESTFAPSPPLAPKSATYHPLSDEPKHLTTPSRTSSSSSKTGYPSYSLSLPPSSDPYLCIESNGLADYTSPTGNTDIFDDSLLPLGNKYVLVARGGCSFEAKARSAQRLGAKGIIIRNTLESRYGTKDNVALSGNDNATNNGVTGPDWTNTAWPQKERDFECGTKKAVNGIGLRAEIDVSKLNFDPPPYDANHNDVLLSGTEDDGNLCASEFTNSRPRHDRVSLRRLIRDHSSDFTRLCPSQRCLLTGQNATADGSKLEACCAWDVGLVMFSDGYDDDAVREEEEEDIIIPALFVTMKDGEELYDLLIDSDANTGINDGSVQFISVVPYARWHPSFHYSAILLWALAVFTMWLSCDQSAKDYKRSWKKISVALNEGVLIFHSGDNGNNGRERSNTEDTVDLTDDFEMAVDNNVNDLQLQLEMAERNGAHGNGETSESRNVASEEVTSDSNENVDTEGATTAGPFSQNGSRDDSNDDSDPKPQTSNETTSDSGSVVTDEVAMTNEEETTPTVQQQHESPSTDPNVADITIPTPSHQHRLQLQPQAAPASEQRMELKAFHAVIFVAVASSLLFLLFFFNLYKVVRILYGLGGSSCMASIIIQPLFNLASTKVALISKYFQRDAFGNLPLLRSLRLKWIDVASSATAFGLGITWIYIGFNRVDPLANTYYWFIQDVMGVCYCILILGIIHVNTIMVATLLLVLVFFYDIFYVFITPYFFGSSVMIDVATGSSFVDADFCEKYPSDSSCRGSKAPLPMILALPWSGDFRGGYSMLGLGDIVLPGLLISFAARFDAAKSLVKKCSRAAAGRNSENEENDEPFSRFQYYFGRIHKALFDKYFIPLVISYAVGLCVAYIVAWLTGRGQPALLYLVPCCLGATGFLGWRKRELHDLWTGPKVMRKANRIVATARGLPEIRAAAAAAAENELAETTSIA